MIKFEKIKAGMTLYDVRKNNWRFNLGVESPYVYWPVYVQAVDPEKREVLASWNSNPAKWMSERQVTKYRTALPKRK